jgi:hypothetical protein
MNNTTTPEERLQALEFLLGQALLTIEGDSAAIRARLDRIEAAVTRIAPDKLAPPSEEEQEEIPFTLDSLGSWMQTCLERMRAHQSVSARKMVAIGEVTERVLSLGEHLSEPTPPEVGPAARAAIEKVKHRKPEA